MIGLLSFDLDGTLADTGGEIAAAANATLREFGLPPQPQREIEALVGAGAEALMLRLLARLDGRKCLDTGTVLERFAVHYDAHAGTSARPYPGCVEAVVRLRDAGVRLACVTNKPQRQARRVLETCALAAHFGMLVGGDTLPFKKPDARVLRHVLAAYACPPDRAVHVGDSETDLAAARNAGVAGWAVSWGYNGGVPIARARPVCLFERFDAVAEAALRSSPPGLTAS